MANATSRRKQPPQLANCPKRRHTSALAEHRFRCILSAQGAELRTAYVNTTTSVEVQCAAGHVTSVMPANVLSRDAFGCRTCAGKGPKEAFERFRAHVVNFGGEVLESGWLGSSVGHACRCPEGHLCSPTPGHLNRGGWLCRSCQGRSWDVFYVVKNGEARAVKYGITSGNPRARLTFHARDGFDKVVRLRERLPRGSALKVERSVTKALRGSGEVPVRGREYFPARVLPMVLDIVDNHPVFR